MRRSVRNLLTVAVASAATAVALGVPATAASAAPADPEPKALIAPPPGPTNWGSYFSSNFKAKAKGTLETKWNPSGTLNSVQIKGKLYDLDFRTLQQGGKCAYVEVYVNHLYKPAWQWNFAKSAKLCNAGQVKHFYTKKYNVKKVRIRVSQIGLYSNVVVNKGAWHQITV